MFLGTTICFSFDCDYFLDAWQQNKLIDQLHLRKGFLSMIFPKKFAMFYMEGNDSFQFYI